ncbi:MAG: MFS transporter [Candidatus Thorarchaeota archaeon]|nr:MFS transporter [Candidatus Thorarchaeota archaeon]
MTIQDERSAGVTSVAGPGPYKIVAATSFGIFLGALDSSIVNVSLVTMAASLGVGLAEIQWVVLAYLLILTSFMPLMGKLGDRYGKAKVFQVGMAVFITGSLICAISSDLLPLIGFRAFQALGASMMTANGLALVTYYTTPENRGRAIGMNSIVLAAALGSGPVLGGILSEFFGWQSIFLINLPIGVIGYVIFARTVPETERVEETRFDTLGAALFLVFLFTLVYMISVAKDNEPLVIVLLAAVVIASLLWFVMRESRFESPVIPTSVLADRRISTGIFSALLAYMAIVPVTYLFPIFLQEELNLGPAITGLIITAHPIVISVIGPISGVVSERVRAKRQTVLGILLQLIGLVFLGFAVPNIPLIVVGIIIMGLGLSLFSVANGNFIMTSAPKEYMGVISALTNIARTTGFSIATALVTTVFLFYQEALPYSPAFQFTIWTFAFLALIAAGISALRGLSPAEEERIKKLSSKEVIAE